MPASCNPITPATPARQLRTLSLLTPVHRHTRAVEYLTELYASVRAQQLPSGWVLEWVVWEDGEWPSLGEELLQAVDKDPRVLYGANGLQGGPAITRTQAFHASRGDVVFSIDHDDYLEPGGLHALLTALEAHPEAAWATGRTFEVTEGQDRRERTDYIVSGVVPAGYTLELWNTAGVSTPWYPTATAYQRWAVSLLGAWPANGAGGEDIELLACVTAAWGGIVIDEHTMTRRRWDGQNTRNPVVQAAAGDNRRARHKRATLIDSWRRSGLLGGPCDTGT